MATTTENTEYASLDALGAAAMAGAVALAGAHEYYAAIIVGIVGFACFAIKHFWN
jgi:hypothetical protein